MVDTRHRDPWPACHRRPIRRNARGFGRGGGGGPTPFDPSQIAGLEAWYRGDSYAGGTLIDKSGKSRNLPAIGTVTQTSRAGQLALQFGGAGRFTGALGGVVAQPITIYFVFEPTSLGAIQSWYDGDDVTNRVNLYTDTAPSYHFRAINDLAGGTPTLGIHATCHVANTAASAAYVDNFASPMASGFGGTASLDGFTIGGNYAGGQFVSGYIWDTIVYSGAHDAETRAKFAGYFTARYAGLQIAT